jgi:hypothetical protein
MSTISYCKDYRSPWRTPCPRLSSGGFVLEVTISLSDQIVPRRPFPGFLSRKFLTYSTFGNSISSSILGDGVCMSTRLKNNTFVSVWNTRCPGWYSGVFVIVDTISLNDQLFWIFFKQSPFTTCKGISYI